MWVPGILMHALLPLLL